MDPQRGDHRSPAAFGEQLLRAMQREYFTPSQLPVPGQQGPLANGAWLPLPVSNSGIWASRYTPVGQTVNATTPRIVQWYASKADGLDTSNATKTTVQTAGTYLVIAYAAVTEVSTTPEQISVGMGLDVLINGSAQTGGGAALGHFHPTVGGGKAGSTWQIAAGALGGGIPTVDYLLPNEAGYEGGATIVLVRTCSPGDYIELQVTSDADGQVDSATLAVVQIG